MVADIVSLVVVLARQHEHHGVSGEVEKLAPDSWADKQSLVGTVEEDLPALSAILEQHAALSRNGDENLLQSAMRMRASAHILLRAVDVINALDPEGDRLRRLDGDQIPAPVAAHLKLQHPAISQPA